LKTNECQVLLEVQVHQALEVYTLFFRTANLSWAHSSAAELPTPNSAQDTRINLTHVQARQGLNLGL